MRINRNFLLAIATCEGEAKRRGPGDRALKTDGVPMETISIVPCGPSWAVKHAGSFLGYASSIEEAASIGERLVSWLQGEGRAVELRVASRERDGWDGRWPSQSSSRDRFASEDRSAGLKSGAPA